MAEQGDNEDSGSKGNAGPPSSPKRRAKAARTRRGHPKNENLAPGAEDLRRIAAKRYPDGTPDWFPKDKVLRDHRGRFSKGTPSPNPLGPKAGRTDEARMFGKSQTVKDLLELLEQPVTIRKGKVRKQVPAIIAIYDRMIHMAINGDWNAMKKLVEMRERYSDFRHKTLVGLTERVQECRQRYKDYGEEIPDHVEKILREVEERVREGQYEAG